MGVDAKQLAEQAALVLRVLARIACAARHRRWPRRACRPARIGAGRRCGSRRRGAGLRSPGGASAPWRPCWSAARNSSICRLPGGVRVVGVEEAVPAVAGVEGDREQARARPRSRLVGGCRGTAGAGGCRGEPPAPCRRLRRRRGGGGRRGVGDVGRHGEVADPRLPIPPRPSPTRELDAASARVRGPTRAASPSVQGEGHEARAPRAKLCPGLLAGAFGALTRLFRS